MTGGGGPRKRESYSSQLSIKTHKTRVLILTIVCILAANSLLVFSSADSRAVMIDLTAVATSGAALIVSGGSLLMNYLRKSGDKIHFWISIGLTFWFAAEVIWAYTRQVIGD